MILWVCILILPFPYKELRLNGDVVGVFVASSNDTLKGVLQLGEVQAGLRLTVPAAQHQLVPVAIAQVMVITGGRIDN